MPEEIANADTALSVDSASADTSIDQNAPAVDTAPDGSAPADTQTDQQSDALTPPTSVRAPQTAQPVQDQAVDPVKDLASMRSRYDELRAYTNRVANENEKFRKQWDGLDPQRVRDPALENRRQARIAPGWLRQCADNLAVPVSECRRRRLARWRRGVARLPGWDPHWNCRSRARPRSARRAAGYY